MLRLFSVEYLKRSNLPKLQKILVQTSSDVVRLQELFDQAHDQELQQIAPHLKTNSPVEELLHQALLPRRMVVGKQELKYKLRVEREKKLGFELGFKTIPLNFEILMEKKSIHQQNVRVNVEQVPLAKNPFFNT